MKEKSDFNKAISGLVKAIKLLSKSLQLLDDRINLLEAESDARATLEREKNAA